MSVLRRFAMTILGGTLLLAGLAMLVLPGPGVLLVVAGLAVLATEYVWAQRLLHGARVRARKAQESAVASPVRTAGSIVFAIGMVTVGVLPFVVPDVTWPVLDELGDRLWSRPLGGVLVVMGLVVLTTTYLTLRAARGKGTTHAPAAGVRARSVSGASRGR